MKPNKALAVDPSTALNGAQVTAFRQFLLDAATKQLPRESAVEAIAAAFPLSVEQADKVMGEVGKTFFVEPPAPSKPFGAPAQPPDEVPTYEPTEDNAA